MAETLYAEAYTIVGDSAKKKFRVGLRVDSVDAKAYVAALDTAARNATKVGILLAAIEEMQLPDTGGNIYKRGLDYGFLELPFAFPPSGDFIYGSNKMKIDFVTDNAGLPATGFFTIPAYDEAEISMESNGINVVISGLSVTAEVTALIAAVADTMLSSYGTAAAVNEITVNDV